MTKSRVTAFALHGENVVKTLNGTTVLVNASAHEDKSVQLNQSLTLNCANAFAIKTTSVETDFILIMKIAVATANKMKLALSVQNSIRICVHVFLTRRLRVQVDLCTTKSPARAFVNQLRPAQTFKCLTAKFAAAFVQNPSSVNQANSFTRNFVYASTEFLRKLTTVSIIHIRNILD